MSVIEIEHLSRDFGGGKGILMYLFRLERAKCSAFLDRMAPGRQPRFDILWDFESKIRKLHDQWSGLLEGK